jgi:hypothetical protein
MALPAAVPYRKLFALAPASKPFLGGTLSQRS